MHEFLKCFVLKMVIYLDIIAYPILVDVVFI